MNAAGKNFWTAVTAAVICAVLLIAIAALSIGRSSDFIQRRPSTFYTDPTGARALLLVLERVLPGVRQWQRPFSDLPFAAPSRSTLIVMGPQEPLGEAEAAVLDQWIRSGGQLILAASNEWKIRKPQKVGDEDAFLSQGYLARHALKAIPGAGQTDANTAAVSQSAGKGRILFIADSYALSNQELAGTDNAVWLVTRASEWGGGTLIDEYHQGFGERKTLPMLAAMFAASPWGFLCMQLVLAGLVYILGVRRRFGRPVEQLPVERTSPIEAVEALGGLFETAKASALSVRTIHQYLNLQLSALFGYAVDLSNPAVRERLAVRSSISKGQLDAYSEAIQRAIEGETTTSAEFIRIAREATMISRSFSHGNARHRSISAG